MKNEKRTIPANDITELVFILDRSGSMSGLEEDTIGGFNSLIKKQRALPGTCYVSTVLFDHETVVLHDRVPLERVRLMTEDDYQVRGCTALLDAVGGAIHHIANVHKYARREDVPANTLFVITTDGLENASRRYSSDMVKAMIEREKGEYGWEFLFLGANIDAVESAKRIGIEAGRAANYHADSRGTSVVFDAVGEALGQVRCGAPMASGWSASIDADYAGRKAERR